MKIYSFEQIDSTNTFAKQIAAESEHGTMVTAVRQSAGRGRSGKSFMSPQGGAYFSIILRREIPQNLISLVTPCIAVAVHNAVLQVFAIDTDIKWVNDLYLCGKKVCGILTERTDSAIIIGIGINIVPPQGGFSDEIADIAAALVPSCTEQQRSELIELCRQNILLSTDNLGQRDFLAEYRRKNLVLGRKITVIGENSWQGTAIEIKDDCSLIVQRETGELVRIASSEVSIALK